MLIPVISAAKKIVKRPVRGDMIRHQPALIQSTAELVEIMRGMTAFEIAELMGVSEGIARLNFERYQQFEVPLPYDAASPAIYTFTGDVYVGLDAPSMSDEEVAYADECLIMLSGLYGMLRACDAMLPYRLEMGVKLTNKRGANLYDFWREELEGVVLEFARNYGANAIINLASNEYFKALDVFGIRDKLPVVNVHFQEWRDGKYKTIVLYTKKARGMMARYIIRERLKEPQEILAFDEAGYKYHPEFSDDENIYFVR